jgi:3-oxoacyl-[acyl-carrier-protein] synthase-3
VANLQQETGHVAGPASFRRNNVDKPDAHILAVGTALPGPALDNATLAKRFGMPPVWEQWVDTFVGTGTRHLSRDLGTGEVRYTLTDLCVTAASQALERAGIAAAQVDLMVLATASPDALMPATVNMVADQLGIDGVPTYQLLSGCTGAVQALDVACKMLLGGGYRTALVIGGDSCAKHLDVNIDVAAQSPAEQVNGMLFGDGAGAAVLSAEPASGAVAVRHVAVRLVGRNRPPGQVVEWFGQAERGDPRPGVIEDYKAIEESVPTLTVEAFNELLDELGWTEEDVDYLLPPQLSGRMTERITSGLNLPVATKVNCVTEIGNTGNSIPFFQLERAMPRMVAGDRAVAVAIESSKWIKAAFALESI